MLVVGDVEISFVQKVSRIKVLFVYLAGIQNIVPFPFIINVVGFSKNCLILNAYLGEMVFLIFAVDARSIFYRLSTLINVILILSISSHVTRRSDHGVDYIQKKECIQDARKWTWSLLIH